MDDRRNSEETQDLRTVRNSDRIARMRREKQLQLRRRRRMKQFLRLLAVVLAVSVPVGVLVSRKRKGSGQEETIQSTSLYSKEFVREYEKPVEGKASPDASPMKAEGLPDGFSGFAETEETQTLVPEGEVVSSYAILVDETTDTIVARREERESVSPASMTKVLTVLVAAEAISDSQLEDTFTITREITDYGFVNDCSVVGFLEGEEVTVRDLFYGTILSSGCDAALGLAMYVAGSQEAFVERMNRKLEELGLADSAHFTNCVGLYDKEHYCSVYDMAIIMKAAIGNELCKEVLSARTYTTTKTVQHPEGIHISNWFIRRIEDKDMGGTVLAAKTGYVTQSGSCAVSYGQFPDGKTYICATADSTTSWRCIYDHVAIYKEYAGRR